MAKKHKKTNIKKEKLVADIEEAMKDPKKMTTEELIELADEIKRGMTTKVMKDLDKLEKSRSHLAKQS